MKRLLIFVALILSLGIPGLTQTAIRHAMYSAASSSPLITAVAGSGLRNDLTYCLGFRFTTPSSNPPIATELGRYKIAGNSGTHVIYLMNSSGSILTSASVDLTTVSNGQFAWATISPYSTAASTTYYVMSSETVSGDQWYDQSQVTSVGQVTMAGAAFQAACSGAPGDVGGTTQAYGPPNIKFQD